MRTLIIDNHDSFTYNLFQLAAEVNQVLPVVIKSDELTWERLANNHFDNIIISPGPGHPESEQNFGFNLQVIQQTNLPILGVCLGHQGICCAFGGKVIHAPVPMHGRTSHIIHQHDLLFADIPSPFKVVRYHSLISESALPKELEAIAWSEDQLVMAVRHQTRPIWGVQFHPESICSEYGFQLLQNFKKLSEAFHVKSGRSIKLSHRMTNQTVKKIQPKENYEIYIKQLKQNFNAASIFDYLYQQNRASSWLDSNKQINEMGRFSFICLNDGPLSFSLQYYVENNRLIIKKKNQIIEKQASIFTFLQAELNHYTVTAPSLPFHFNGGFVGYLGYELKAETTSVKNQHQSTLPDAQFLFTDRIITFDHQEKICYLLTLAKKENAVAAQAWLNEISAELAQGCNVQMNKKNQPADVNTSYYSRDQQTYLQNIQTCLQHIKNGESYEICLTNKIKFDMTISPDAYYYQLRTLNPAPYATFLKWEDCAIACSSMERFLTIDTEGNVETKPIKGTLPRGSTPIEDVALKTKLVEDEKFRSENLMIVDLLRNDLGRVCEIGSVHVPTLMQVETYETVHQLVSTIKGKLRAEFTAIDALKATFPGGSMTGAPKIRTMELIDNIEQEARGIYAGAIGYLALNGSADFNIVIRTAVMMENHISIGVGGAITALSDPLEEHAEMMLKGAVLKKALESA
jgi:para-aminobenzoate synthetase